MDVLLYVVRHAKATGQEPEAKLTKKGESDAHGLTHFFKNKKVEQIISSPFERALATIKPTAEQLGLPIIEDVRLTERILSRKPLDDWLTSLQASFKDHNAKFSGGESSNEAKRRVLAVFEEVAQTSKSTIIVSHGNLIALLLNELDQTVGFLDWKEMKNPDVFQIQLHTRTFKKKSALD